MCGITASWKESALHSALLGNTEWERYWVEFLHIILGNQNVLKFLHYHSLSEIQKHNVNMHFYILCFYIVHCISYSFRIICYFQRFRHTKGRYPPKRNVSMCPRKPTFFPSLYKDIYLHYLLSQSLNHSRARPQDPNNHGSQADNSHKDRTKSNTG